MKCYLSLKNIDSSLCYFCEKRVSLTRTVFAGDVQLWRLFQAAMRHVATNCDQENYLLCEKFYLQGQVTPWFQAQMMWFQMWFQAQMTGQCQSRVLAWEEWSEWSEWSEWAVDIDLGIRNGLLTGKSVNDVIWDYLKTKQKYLDVVHFIVISHKSEYDLNLDFVHSFRPTAKLLV